MKKALYLIIVVILISCKKNACHGGCLLIVDSQGSLGNKDTIAKGSSDICSIYDEYKKGKGTDAVGNPVTASQSHLVCP